MLTKELVTAAFQQILDVRSEGLSEDQLIITQEQSGHGEKDENGPEEVMPVRNLTLNELLEILHNTLRTQRTKRWKLIHTRGCNSLLPHRKDVHSV